MIIRWQCTSWGGAEDYAWAMLEASQTLLRRLEPQAEFHVTYQAQQLGHRPDTIYHHQNTEGLVGPSWGKFKPARFAPQDKEIWLDNDVIMWDLPPGWKRFAADETGKVGLGNICLTGYHGTFTYRMRKPLSSGFFGLPPGYAPHIQTGWLDAEGRPIAGMNHDQEEMGALAFYLTENFDDEHLALIDMEKEVPCYNPLSFPGSPYPIVRLDWGRYGVHLSGCNRRHFNPMPILDWIMKHDGVVPPFPLERAKECERIGR